MERGQSAPSTRLPRGRIRHRRRGEEAGTPPFRNLSPTPWTRNSVTLNVSKSPEVSLYPALRGKSRRSSEIPPLRRRPSTRSRGPCPRPRRSLTPPRCRAASSRSVLGPRLGGGDTSASGGPQSGSQGSSVCPPARRPPRRVDTGAGGAGLDPEFTVDNMIGQLQIFLLNVGRK